MFLSRFILSSVTFVVSSCLLAAADPNPKPAEMILGRWQGESTFTIKSNREGVKDEVFTRKVFVEFKKDGTVTYTEGDIPELKNRVPGSEKGSSVTGKYSFVKDTEIELTIEEDGKRRTLKSKVAVTNEELSLTSLVQGKDVKSPKFKRAKDKD
ncbi:hypothetical protein [Frigoriglobus tundricola]|uniref:Lipocalin-like domain-containing protein n=1 Tax=Frigoriglobus tundricola TaxID=2774151 RepID=A0A6M5YZE7_9BACT|nr:hypothetical protein [Frigoriglobus tundricola]QJW98601.1 hypothetical protein FTUN_6196 [Frigoriglobus tundricola]